MGHGCGGCGLCRGVVPVAQAASVCYGSVGVSRRQWPAGACTALAEVSAACDAAAGQSTVCKALTPTSVRVCGVGPLPCCLHPSQLVPLLCWDSCRAVCPGSSSCFTLRVLGRRLCLQACWQYSIGSQEHEPPLGELSGDGARQVVGVCAVRMLRGRVLLVVLDLPVALLLGGVHPCRSGRCGPS
jgi:hypothetical protein